MNEIVIMWQTIELEKLPKLEISRDLPMLARKASTAILRHSPKDWG